MAQRPVPLNDDATLMEPPAEDRADFGRAFERIVGIMARLRGPGGCPWDREQTLDSLKAYLVEETYEVLEAIEDGVVDAHREELGDLLLQVVFQAELRREAGEFDAADVAHAISDKLIRRHPHVFGEHQAADGKQALEHWERMKAREKEGRSAIDGVPRALPGLLRAQRVTEKASRNGFDWSDVQGALAKLKEEIGELEEAIASGSSSAQADELGDVLFSAVNVARFVGVQAEDAMQAATQKFDTRFRKVEAEVRARGVEVKSLEIDELEALWQAAK